MFMLLLDLGFWAVGHQSVPAPVVGAQQALAAVQAATFTAVVIWVLYLGLEPYVRRFWPHSIISWSRLLQGRLRDPLIGRDLLVGVAVGVGIVLLQQLNVLLTAHVIHTPPLPLLPGSEDALGELLGFRHTVMASMQALRTVVGRGVMILMLMLLIRLAVKNSWLTGGLVFLLLTTAYALGGKSAGVPAWIMSAIVAAGMTVVLIRAGFLAMVVSSFTVRFILSNPLTSDPGSWCAGETAFTVALMVTLLAFGLYASTVEDRPALRTA